MSDAAAACDAVHPRGCGEQDLALPRPPWAPGSSPRVRGTGHQDAARWTDHRFIPAGAGNRHVVRHAHSHVSVHPRGCGEQISARRRRMMIRGSSPRVRGTARLLRTGIPLQRFIPAGAGNRPGMSWSRWRRPVHPRGCGEQLRPTHGMSNRAGSSPRVRGTEGPSECLPYPHRFIPAGAGNSQVVGAPPAEEPVHPRGCGEQNAVTRERLFTNGSSPRVRGTVTHRIRDNRARRFIPAGAGNSHAPCRHGHCPPVHPRGCGEQLPTPISSSRNNGSSPRVRGTVPLAGHAGRCCRFIPAGAGNSPHGTPPSRHGPVYPRGCGEQFDASGLNPFRNGSSPRVRGTGDVPTWGAGLPRFIPAGAGNRPRCSR